MATLEEITERFRTAVADDGALNASLKFNLKEDGVILIEGCGVSNDDRPADLTVTTRKRHLEDLEAGRLDPMTAVMSGKLRFSNMGLAMQLQPRLQALFRKLR